MAKIDWFEVKEFSKGIGAVGIMGSDACVLVSYFEDLDGDRSGKVSWGEWVAGKVSPFSLEGYATTQVAMAARFDLRILERDPSFHDMANKMFLNFAHGLVMDGIYAAYFSRGVSLVGGGAAKLITQGMVKEFVVKKGFEAAVKKAFMAGVDR